MMEIKLDDRLRSIVSFIRPGSIVADIGTDHGLVPNYLVENNIASLVYATDISEKSLQKNKDFTKKRNNQDGVISLLGDGLNPIKDLQVDLIIIAGMGGDLVISILDQGLDYLKDKDILIQAQTAVPKVRAYLQTQGFEIRQEKIAKVSSIYYEIILASYDESPSLKRIDFGQNLIEEKDPILIEYVKSLYEKNCQIIGILKDLESPRSELAIQRLKEENQSYQEVLNECKS